MVMTSHAVMVFGWDSKFTLKVALNLLLLTVAINELLCMKNAGAQIAMDFS